MVAMFSGSCETAGKEGDVGDQDPGFGTGDGCLEVLGEPAVASEPGEGGFDHPTVRLRLDSSDLLRSGNDLDPPPAAFGDPGAQVIPAIDPGSEAVAQHGDDPAQRGEHRHRAPL